MYTTQAQKQCTLLKHNSSICMDHKKALQKVSRLMDTNEKCLCLLPFL